MQLILASGSPRRRELLAEAGYEFEVIPAEVEEWEGGTFPIRELCAANATLKAREVHQKHREAVVLGADTLVGLDGKVLGKPHDLVEAMCMLEGLAGRFHEVCTGVCVCGGEREHAFFEVTRVQFHDFGAEVIKEYTQRVNVIDKAGSYAIQEHGEMLVANVEGSYENVVGLPVARVAEELGRFEVWPKE